MAFTRAYARQDEGDPFRFRIPKVIRKLTLKKVAKGIGSAVKFAAPFVPGVGGAIAQMLPEPARPAMPEPAPMPAPMPMQAYEPEPEYYEPPRRYKRARYYEPPDEYDEDEGMQYDQEDQPMSFARMYGYDDWSGDPKPVPKRKQAASGPKAKAKRKANVRQNRAAKKGGARGPDWQKIGAQAKRFGKGALDVGGKVLPYALELVPGSGIARAGIRAAGSMMQRPGAEDFALPAGGFAMPRGKRVPGFGGKRHTMNPTNVKALKRSIRRLEGFQKVVKRVAKMLPPAARHTLTGSAPSHRGHKAGCKCFGCKK